MSTLLATLHQAVIRPARPDDREALRAVEHVNDGVFYAEKHRRIFRAMVSIAEKGSVVDPFTLSDELARRGELDGAGGKEYIGFLMDIVPTAASS